MGERQKISAPPLPELLSRGAGVRRAALQNALALVDKPLGITAADVCDQLRVVSGTKVSYCSYPLDPGATGLLLLRIGGPKKKRGTDMSAAADSEMTGTMRLGAGEAAQGGEAAAGASQPWEHVSDEALEGARQTFLGTVQQQVPEELRASWADSKADEGRERTVRVRDLELSREAGVSDVAFRIVGSKGVHVQALMQDLARAAGTVGRVRAWRRERIGMYTVQDAWPLDDLLTALEAACRADAVPRSAASE